MHWSRSGGAHAERIARGCTIDSHLGGRARRSAGTGRRTCLLAQESEPVEPEAEASEQEGSRIRRLGDSLSVAPEEEWVPGISIDAGRERINALLREARDRQAQGQLVDPASDNAAERYAQVLDLDPGNEEARAGLQAALAALAEQAETELDAGDRAAASAAIERMRALDPADNRMAALAGGLRQAERIAELQIRAEAATLDEIWSGPDGAVALWRTLRDLSPGNEAFDAELSSIAERVRTAALAAAEQGDLAGALTLAESASSAGTVVEPGEIAVRVEALVESAIEAGEFDRAAALAEELTTIAPDVAARAAGQIEERRLELAFPVGMTFSDDGGPTLRVIELDDGTRLAVGLFEVSVAEFRVFVDATGFETDAERTDGSLIYDEGSGGFTRDERADWRTDFLGASAEPELPVVHVSRDDARSYLGWLSDRSGATYRLPRGPEFEAFAGAGAATLYWWGNETPSDPVENLAGLRDRFDDDSSWTAGFRGYGDGFWGPAPVGQFPANPAGFHDTLGNVMEWNEDCFDDRAEEDCELFGVRGGAWSSRPEAAQFRNSARAGTTDRSSFVGFRVVRELR